MIYIEYFIAAAVVVALAIKASNYVNLLEKYTGLPGTFLGGVMLSIITSLPELFTCLSAALILHKPGICMGDILGSNLFNLASLSVIILAFSKPFVKGRVASSYRKLIGAIVLIYVLIGLYFLHILNFWIASVSITSVGIIFIYVVSTKYMSTVRDVEADEDAFRYVAYLNTDLSVKQLVIRFVIAGAGLVIASIVVTNLAGAIAVKLNLVQGFAGALCLGVATSLPEVTATITLFKLKNYDMAIGNIIGSNLFNFMALAITDVVSFGTGIYDAPDPKNFFLLVFGIVSTPLLWIMLKHRNKTTEFLCPLAIIGCYIGFLLI